MGQAAAAVIDLEEFRRRQARRETAKPGMSTPLRRQPPIVPFWVVWIPVWPVA
jgi:hypothetical protein